MFNYKQVEKPQLRNNLRKVIGKEYFIFKRKWNWFANCKNFAKINNQIKLNFPIITHKSFLLRPLKDVDMYLQQNKITNLKIAIEKLNSVVIKPNETFSLWFLVGKPTSKKGYLEGLVLDNGKISKGIGGGLCQLGNLIYWMALHTPLTIKERHRHSYDVFPDINRTIPFACGATLSYNYIDLQLKNNSNYTFQINFWLDETHLNGRILCDTPLDTKYEIFETDPMFKLQWWGGYTRHNRIWKKITNIKTKESSEELVAENNAIMMYNPMIENKNTM